MQIGSRFLELKNARINRYRFTHYRFARRFKHQSPALLIFFAFSSTSPLSDDTGPSTERHSKRFDNERLLLEHEKDLVDVFVCESSRHEVINKAFLELLSLVSASRPHEGIESAFAAKLSASVYII